MIPRQFQARIASGIVCWEVRYGSYPFKLVPPDTRFILSGCRRASQLCLDGADPCCAAWQALRETEQNEISLVAAIIAPIAARCAMKFQLEADELTNETLVRVLPSIRWNFKPRHGFHGSDIPTQSLRQFLSPVVYRTAYKLRYGRERGRSNLEDVLLAQAEDELNMLSESRAREDYEEIMQTLAREFARNPRYARRFSAIMHSDSIAEAAQTLGLRRNTLDKWLGWVRTRHFG